MAEQDANSSNFKQMTYYSIKQRRIEIWNKAQRTLPSILQDIILDKILQPNEIKEILQDLNKYLIVDWCWPKLSISNINVNPSNIMIRSLHKGLVKLASVDYNYPLDIFPKIVSIILEELRSDREEISMIIFSGIEERRIAEIIYPFQIYYLTHTISRKRWYLKN